MSLLTLFDLLNWKCDFISSFLIQVLVLYSKIKKSWDGAKKLNCFYSIFAKKRNSHGHLKYIKNIKLYLRIIFLVLSLCAHPKKIYFLLNSINLPLCYLGWKTNALFLENHRSSFRPTEFDEPNVTFGSNLEKVNSFCWIGWHVIKIKVW